jgi:hypothetical protein
MTFYHGTTIDIKDKLIPRPSKVIDNEKAVFATNNIMLATIFISNFKNQDIDLSKYGGKWFLIEQRPNAFKELLKNKSGIIYHLDSSSFSNDKRLGLQGIEFISKTPVKILKKKVIKDIWKCILKYKRNKELIVMTFDDLADYLSKYKQK